MDNPEVITVLSLCSGYGGLELGLSRALADSLRVVAVEIEAYALANLVSKAEESKLAVEALWPDLRTFPAERFRGCFDFILAGYPCQPFSIAGKRAGGTDERHLWPLICRIIEAVRPFYVMLENVPGLLSGRILDNRPDLVEYLAALAQEERKADARHRWYIGEHRRRFTTRLLQQEGIQAYAGVYLDLQDLAYQVEPGLFSSAEVGAPHKRERLFILAHRESKRNLPIQQQGQGGGVEPGGEAMADRTSPRLAGPTGQRGSGQPLLPSERENNELQLASFAGSSCLWPARPGEPQYEWEEPRVMGGSESTRRRGQMQERQKEGGIAVGRASETMGDARGRTSKGLSQPEGRKLDRETGNTSGRGQAQ